MIYLNVFIYSKTDILGYKIFYGLHKLNNIYFFVFLFLMILVTYLTKKKPLDRGLFYFVAGARLELTTFGL